MKTLALLFSPLPAAPLSTVFTIVPSLAESPWSVTLQSRLDFSAVKVLITFVAVLLPWCLVFVSFISRARSMAAERAETLVLGPNPRSPSRSEPAVPDEVSQQRTPLPPDRKDPKCISHENEYYEADTGPLHFHAMRQGSARIKPRPGMGPGGLGASGRSLSGRSLSRSRSASPPNAGSTSVSMLDMDDSSISLHSLSLDGSFHAVNPDILTDRMGFEELEPTAPITHINSLTLVPERMSEETMDDCHAFSNLTSVKRSSVKSSDGSVSGADVPSSNTSILDILKEEEGDDSDLSDEEPRRNDRKLLAQQVIIELEKVEETAAKEGE